MRAHEFITEDKKRTLRNTNPCWKGYEPIGTKEKDGKTVPNCVPKKSKTNEEIVNEIGVKLSNYSGQVLAGDVVRAPKGFKLGGKKLEKSLQLKVTSIHREGINKYRLKLKDEKTGKTYTTRNYMMDGEYKGEKMPKWGMVRKSKKDKKDK